MATKYQMTAYLSDLLDILERIEGRIGNMLEHDTKRSVGLSDSDRFWMRESKLELHETRLKARKILEGSYDDV